MNPVFVIEPVPWNYEDDALGKSVEEHLAQKPDELAAIWGTGQAAIDLKFLDDSILSSGEHPLEWVTREARVRGLPLVPSVGTSRTQDYISAAARVAARDGDGVTIRVTPRDLSTGAGGAGALSSLLTTLKLAPDNVDLVLDFGDKISADPALSLAAAQGGLATLPQLNIWRSVTVAGGGFPKNLSGMSKGATVLDRHEWNLYTALLASSPARIPIFGDYAIAHPNPIVDVNPAWMAISGSLRYTVDAHWVVFKGDLFRGAGSSGLGSAAVIPLARALILHPQWMGATHCEMEAWVAAVDCGNANGGGPEQWRKYGTCHHLIHVANQLASLGVI